MHNGEGSLPATSVKRNAIDRVIAWSICLLAMILHASSLSDNYDWTIDLVALPLLGGVALGVFNYRAEEFPALQSNSPGIQNNSAKSESIFSWLLLVPVLVSFSVMVVAQSAGTYDLPGWWLVLIGGAIGGEAGKLFKFRSLARKSQV